MKFKSLKLKYTLVIIIPFLLVGIILQYYLNLSSERIFRTFESANKREILSGNAISVNSRLIHFSTAIPWVCIEAYKDNQNFIRLERGECKAVLFYQVEKIIDKRSTGGILIRFILTLDTEIYLVGCVFATVVAVLLLLLVYFIDKSQKMIVKHIMLENERQLAQQKMKTKAAEAIALTTQHLAHDIRKPFTLIRTVLQSFDMFKNNQSRLNSAKNDVDKAISSVESMIHDIMDFSREVKVQTKPTFIGGIFAATIRHSLQAYPGADINLSYKFNSSKKLLIDEDRFSRVFQNIIGNAVEAITVIGKKQSGTIFIETNDFYKDNEFWVEIIIGNDGPPFTEGAVNKLFESFYTANKAKGTGLGLASAQKIVHLHNGTITARNKHGGKGVEFVILIPASIEEEIVDIQLLPENIKEVFIVEEENLSELDKLFERVSANQSTFKILLLEDDYLYRAWVKNILIKNEQLHKMVVLFDAATVEEALDILKNNPDIAYGIIDIDLGQVKNGYDFLTAVKDNTKLSCLVHSNRTLPEFKQKAFDLGAKAFVPKPLSLENLIYFLAGSDFKGDIPKSFLPSQKIIYYCDDTSLMRDHFEMLCQKYRDDLGRDINFEIFKTGEELLARAEKKQPHLVLTDLNMQEAGGQLNGYQVIKSIKYLSSRIKVYLISNEPLMLSGQPTKEAGGDGALEQPLDKKILFPIFDRLF